MTLSKLYSPFSSQFLHLPASAPHIPRCACVQRLPSASLCQILSPFKDSRNRSNANKNLPSHMAVSKSQNPVQHIFPVMFVSCIALLVSPARQIIYMRSLIKCQYSHCRSVLTWLNLRASQNCEHSDLN